MNPITRPAARLGLDHVWLVGDSARVVEPFTGEGISFAFSTALLAAEAARNGLARDNLPATFRNYAREHERLYRRRAWVNTLTRWLLVTPGRTVRLLRRVRPAPAVVSFLSDRVHASW
jgi:flavin-dependent dehydrogenase